MKQKIQRVIICCNKIYIYLSKNTKPQIIADADLQNQILKDIEIFLNGHQDPIS